MDQGQRLRDQGIERVTLNNPEFITHMRNHALALARANGEVTSDDLREFASERGVEPEHSNAWGAVFKINF